MATEIAQTKCTCKHPPKFDGAIHHQYNCKRRKAKSIFGSIHLLFAKDQDDARWALECIIADDHRAQGIKKLNRAKFLERRAQRLHGK